MSNIFNALTFGQIEVLAVAATNTTTLDGTSIDVQDYEGVAAIVLNSAKASAGTTPTLNGKIQHSSDDSTFADVTGATFTEITDAADSCQVLALDLSTVKRYIKFVGTIAGASASFVFGASMVAIKKAS